MELRSSGKLFAAFLLLPAFLSGCGTLGGNPNKSDHQLAETPSANALLDSLYFERCLDCSASSYFAKAPSSIAHIDAAGWTTRGGVRYEFVGSLDSALIQETGESVGVVNYVKGDGAEWSYSTRPTAAIQSRGVYPGMAAEFVGAAGGALQYNLLLDAGVNPNIIAIEISNADRIYLDGANALHVVKDDQDVVHSAPFIYQDSSAGRVQVAGNFQVADNTVRFDVPAYDPQLPLVIDPTLTHINVFGGSQDDEALATAVAANGDIIFAGISGSPDLPTEAAFQAAPQGNTDVFVLRTDGVTGDVVYLTYLGGSGKDELEEIAFDANQNLILVGGTNSTNFPTLNAYQGARAGQQDAFITALNPAGDALVFSTYFGGVKRESFYDIDIADDGTLVLGGRTKSVDFPTLTPLQATYGGAGDGMLVRMSSDAATLLMSTYIGGSAIDHVTGVVDIGGTIHFSGDSESADMPVVDAFQASNAGGSDGYLGRLTPADDDLAFGTYVGGSDFDKVVALAAMPGGDIAYVGATLSTDLPTLLPVQAANAGQRDMFMGRVSGNTPLFSSYWGGSKYDRAETVVVDSLGNWFVIGESYRYFPTVDALPDPQLASGGGDSAVVALDIDNQVWFSSAVAVNGKQKSHAAVLDQNRNLVIAGSTDNSAIELGAPPPATGALLDALVIRLQVASNAVPLITSTPVTAVNQGTSYTYAVVASDLDQDALTYALTTAPSGMTIDAAGVISWLPTVPGVFDVTVSVDDSNGGVATQSFQVTVVEVILNGDPEITSTPVTIGNEGMPYEYTVTATDPDQDPLTFGLAVAPAGMTISTEGVISWLPAVAGDFDVTVTVDDSNGGVASQAYQVAVEAAPTGPVITSIDNINGLVGEEVNLSVVATDPLGADVTLGIGPIPLPQGLSFNAVTGALVWTLSADNIGDTEVTISASSGDLTNTETFTVSVVQPDPTDPTGVSGRVYDATAGANGEDLPVVGAVVELLGTGLSATTDSTGSFSLAGEITGGQLLVIDASGAQLAPDGSTYANFQEQIVLPPNVITAIARPFFMPRINAGSLTDIQGASLLTVANTDIGASVEVRPSRVRNPDGSAFTGQMSISEVPKNLAPVALPKFLDPAILVTVQPAGLTFTLNPVPLTIRNIDGLPPGTILDLWSVDPARGVFGIVGKGEVSADGENIETIEGGLRNATWSLFAPMPPEVGPSNTPPGPNTDPKNDDECDSGSSVAVGTGCIATNFSLPAYQSQGQSRELEFVYKSIRANPTEIISVDTNIPMFSPIPLSLSYELSIGGLTVAEPVYTNPLTSAGLIRRSRGGIPFDTSQHATGIYDYEITLRGALPFSNTVDTLGGQLTVVNGIESPFGAGWGLSNLKRLHVNGTGRFLLVDGDGTKQIFNQLRPIQIGSFNEARSLASTDGLVNYSFVDGNLFSAFKDDLLDVSQFGRNGTISRSVAFKPGISEITLESLKGLDIFVLTREAAGQELSFGERAALDQFVQEGGAILELARQPRDEPVLGTTSELVSSPGNTQSYFFVSADEEHPVQDGPFGRAGLMDGGQNASNYTVIGAGAELALRNGSPTVLDFPIGTESAAGAALLFGDSSLATSDHPTNGVENRYSSRNRMVMLNSIAYLSSVPGFRVNDDIGGEEFFGPPGDYSELARLPDGSFRQTMKDGTTYLFDVEGFQTSMVDRNGNATTYAYSTDGLLELITDPKGLETSFGYLAGKLQTVTDPAGRISTFAIDLNGDLESITFPDGASKSYGYNDKHLMERETDQRGFVTTREYDQYGLFESSVLPDGAERSYAPATPVIGIGSVSTNPQPATAVSRSFATFTDGNNHTVQRKTDRLGRLILLTDEEGRTWEIDRDVDGNPLRVAYPSGLVREATYDDLGNVTTTRNSFDNSVVSRTYDQFGLVTSIEDELGGVMTIERDPNGNAAKLVNAVGHEVILTWDPEGRLTNRTGPNGLQISIGYNNQGLVETITRQPSVGLPRIDTFEYDLVGNVSKAISPGGLEIDMGYDEMGRLIMAEDSVGRKLTFDYNLAGARSTTVLASGATIDLSGTFDYDPLGRLAVMQQPHLDGLSSNIASYDLSGFEMSRSDATGDLTSYEYDSVNRLEAILDSEGFYTLFEYNLDDTVASIEAPNGVQTLYEYDLLGRQILETSPDRGILSYSYDLKGRPIQMIDGRGIISTIGYDSLDRIISKNFPSPGEDVTYTYDNCVEGIGQLCSRTDEAGTHTWTYDEFDNVVSSSSLIGAVTRSIDYSYNELDGIVQMTLPSGRVVDYSRDPLNRVMGISTTVNGDNSTVLFSAQYRADDRPTVLVYGNSVVENRQYDKQGRLTSWNIGGVNERVHEYDPDDNLTSIDGGSFDSEYVYDSLNRVTGNTRTVGVSESTFAYDQSDNRLSSSEGNSVTAYSYGADSNRLIGVGPTSMAVDESGNLISTGDGRVFTYNQANRLSSAFNPLSGLTTQYLHNAEGQRVRKNIGSSVMVYTYDIDGNLVSETDEFGVLVREYIWLDGVPIAQIDFLSGTEILTYIHTDHIETPRFATNESGLLAWRWRGDAFGSEAPEQDPLATGSGTVINLRFPGQYYDAETGFHYNSQRTYDPAIGRYLQSDPIGLEGGLNSYAYVENNPLIYTDRTGEFINLASGLGAAGLDILVQLTLNGGRFECVKLGETAVAFAFGAANPLSVIGSANQLRKGLRAKKRVSQAKSAKKKRGVARRAQKNVNAGRRNLIDVAGAEAAALGLGS